MTDRKPSPDDLLTARQIATEYGIPLRTAEGLMRNLGSKGKVERIEGFRRVFVRRRDVEPQSGGTT